MIRKPGETTRQAERRLLGQKKVRAQLEQAAQHRADGQLDAARVIEASLGIEDRPRLKPNVVAALDKLKSGRTSEVYEELRGFDRGDLYMFIQQISADDLEMLSAKASDELTERLAQFGRAEG
jgi:hypothetical protein